MSFSKSPHTTVHYRRNGKPETLGRSGHLPVRGKNSAESVLTAAGVTGPVVLRHHEGALFGKSGKVVRVVHHVVT